MFTKLKALKNEIVLNNYNVNRMDNKGCHIIRELFKAYLCDLRQLPDDVLERYLLVKKNEFDRIKNLELKWLADRGKHFMGHDKTKTKASKFALTEKEIQQVINATNRSRTGKDLRNQDPALITKLMPYLVFDGEYVRTIVDYIAAMTDASAEREMAALYG
jgi:dGTP triphosphohydrolase